MLRADLFAERQVHGKHHEGHRRTDDSERSQDRRVSSSLVLAVHEGRDVPIQWLSNHAVAKEAYPDPQGKPKG